MAKLTKRESKEHAKACEMLQQATLNDEEKQYVLQYWNEGANHINSAAGAFFTPQGLARDFAHEVEGPRVIDLCAGIGALAYAAWNHYTWQRHKLSEIVCVEINADYIAVGKKIIPEATWIQADVLQLPADLTGFDAAISNPPFGNIAKDGQGGPRYGGQEFEYNVIDVASDIARYGVFILPQMSCPFRFSGSRTMEPNAAISRKYNRFNESTGIILGMNCGFDTSTYKDDWNGVSPTVEIAIAEFPERQKGLFA